MTNPLDRPISARAGSESAADVVKRLRSAFDSGRTRPVEWRKEQLRALRRMLADGEVCVHHRPRARSREVRDRRLRHRDRARARGDRLHAPAPRRVVAAREGARPGQAAPGQAPGSTATHSASSSSSARGTTRSSSSSPRSSGRWRRATPRSSSRPRSPSTRRTRSRSSYRSSSIPRPSRSWRAACPETTALLEERWDHIFYTGNGTVGRVVMAAAAKHLTPVTLELGGKSPTIVDRSANLDVAARRIAWGKYINAGQTCVAPDYVLVDRRVEGPLAARLRDTVQRFFGDDPRTSADYGRIVNDRHFARLTRLLDDEGAGEVDLRRRARRSRPLPRADRAAGHRSRRADHAGGDLRPGPAADRGRRHGRGRSTS